MKLYPPESNAAVTLQFEDIAVKKIIILTILVHLKNVKLFFDELLIKMILFKTKYSCWQGRAFLPFLAHCYI